MDDAAPPPRLYGLPPGADFPAELIRGLEHRLAGQPPEAWARVEILVNTARMQRRLTRLFAEGPARLVPRIRLLTRIADDPVLSLPPALPGLRRTLELAQLVRGLIAAQQDLAPPSAAFDLADSLAGIFDEMASEGVPAETLEGLDVAGLSEHWARALRFLTLAGGVTGADALPPAAGRLRMAAEALTERWRTDPPDHPVIVAGSTGSRGPVRLLMEAVARLPQGAVVLPGVDAHMPADIWDGLDEAGGGEDHPQYRYADLSRRLGLHPTEIRPWSDADPAPARAALLSMALRPAPVTDRWMRDGPALGDLDAATREIDLIEADDPAEEADAIAIRLRRAVEDGTRAALVTPDRMLTRRVEAALDRWGIAADDSAGVPLQQTAPGRLLRQVAALMSEPPGAEELLALLKHPLAHSGADRARHLLETREFDLWLRRDPPPEIGPATLAAFAEARPEAAPWARWVAALLPRSPAEAPLAAFVSAHRDLAEALAAGPDGTAAELWAEAPGRAARELMDELAAEAGAGGAMAARDYAELAGALLGARESRRPDEGRADVAIWGTLEARVQGADLVILAGLSEGTWPEAPPPDPWLNRPMRRAAGLLLPERQVGLSAHDFQQAACAPRVVLSRARRDAEAETVAARWLNRLTNLLGGLPETGGKQALERMRNRGDVWIGYARAAAAHRLAAPPAPRPAPCPPVAARPRGLSVTRIQTLIRDPYAIYAERILRLRPLDPLRPEPDAPLRGITVHRILERFVTHGPAPDDPAAAEALRAIAADELAKIPWRAARAMWQAQVDRIADWFVAGEMRRRAEVAETVTERRGEFTVPGTDFALTGTADRIDQRTDGRLVVYDYKTGTPPTDKTIRHFDRQLLLEAAMAEAGAFAGVPRATVAQVCHIGVGAKPSDAPLTLRATEGDAMLDPDATLLELRRLIEGWARRDRGYTALRAVHSMAAQGDYAHLARFGEWSLDDAPRPEEVG